ncbi:MAG: MBL fold metallo-hydrolase [Candidatus Heimdallarchaeaceae archaeon]
MVKIHTIRAGYANIFLIESGDSYIMIDTGPPKSSKKIWAYLNKNNISPDSIKLVIITHGHIDHVGSLKELKQQTKARILIHKEEGKLLEEGKSSKVVATKWLVEKIIPSSKDREVPSIKADILITEEYPLEGYGVNGKVILTPGHTFGSISVIVDSKYAFVGDIAMHFPLLSGLSYEPLIAVDLDQVYDSWEKILAEGVQLIYPTHGKAFNAKKLEKMIKKRKKKD